MERAAPAAELTGVSAGYRRGGIGPRRPVLRDVDLRVPEGRIVALAGPNGAGKTTLIRVLLGFLQPWSGTVRVDASPPEEARRRGRVGYLPEAVALPPGWRVGAFLAEGRRLSATSSAPTYAASAGLERWLGHRTSSLSHGTARRIALSFILASEPSFLVLDEPFAGLDPPARSALARTIAEAAGRSTSILLASHDLDEAERLAHELVVVREGETVAVGPPGSVSRREILALMEGGGG